jgi:hypothetical protein
MMYAARPQILAMIHPDKVDKGLNAQSFTQTLVPDFMSENPELTADWDVVFDDRGHFREPHIQNGRERIIGLGTLAVRNYIKSWTSTLPDEIRNIFVPFDLETSGPTHRYHNALFVEKEGFDVECPRIVSTDLDVLCCKAGEWISMERCGRALVAPAHLARTAVDIARATGASAAVQRQSPTQTSGPSPGVPHREIGMRTAAVP